MRSIKFRAFIDNEMIYDLAYEKYEPINDLLKRTDNLMQFTGLLDKHGVEIYEGDIVNADYYKKPLKVRYSDVLAKFDIDGKYNFSSLNNDIEVIGNIYENQELLKETK